MKQKLRNYIRDALLERRLLERIKHPATFDDIGGMAGLKAWLRSRAKAFAHEARDYGLPTPKSLFLVGIPGTGKSLAAQATASTFGLPLIRLDMARMMEEQSVSGCSGLHDALREAEVASPCVLWIDGIDVGAADKRHVLASLASWMKHKDAPVFVVATAKEVAPLPHGCLLKRCFNECFFIDIPNRLDRTAIWDLVIERYGRDKRDFDTVVLARATETWTGAEIEQAFIEALYLAFADGG
ncbi:MAG: AAA family ATPase [Verrucomicrobiota bacterium]